MQQRPRPPQAPCSSDRVRGRHLRLFLGATLTSYGATSMPSCASLSRMPESMRSGLPSASATGCLSAGSGALCSGRRISRSPIRFQNCGTLISSQLQCWRPLPRSSSASRSWRPAQASSPPRSTSSPRATVFAPDEHDDHVCARALSKPLSMPSLIKCASLGLEHSPFLPRTRTRA